MTQDSSGRVRFGPAEWIALVAVSVVVVGGLLGGAFYMGRMQGDVTNIKASLGEVKTQIKTLSERIRDGERS